MKSDSSSWQLKIRCSLKLRNPIFATQFSIHYSADYESDEDNNSFIKSSSSLTKKPKECESQTLNNLDNPCKSKAENDMIRLAGGEDTVRSITLQCENMLKSGARRLEPRISGGDTVLMEKCIQKQPLSDKSFWCKNHAQIFTYARAMAAQNPKLLVHRNSQVC